MLNLLSPLFVLSLLLASFSASAANDAKWSGFYAGINAGYVWSNPEVNLSVLPDPYLTYVPAPLALSPFMDGATLGLQVGHDWQALSRMVVGLVYDTSWSHMNGSASQSPIKSNAGLSFPATASSSEEIKWFGSLRARIGFLALDDLLIYGTGGVAFAGVNASANYDLRATDNVEYPGSFSTVLPGWVIGSGIEWKVSEHWSISTEYLYSKLQNKTCIADAVPFDPSFQAQYIFNTAFQVARLVISYRF